MGGAGLWGEPLKLGDSVEEQCEDLVQGTQHELLVGSAGIQHLRFLEVVKVVHLLGYWPAHQEPLPQLA